MPTALYTNIVAGVVAWTNRPDLTVEMDMAIKNAVNTAHRAGKFVRDIVTVQLTGQTIEQIQTIDYTQAPFVNYRQLHSIGPTDLDVLYTIHDSLDLFDQDDYARTNIAYVIGTNIHVRAKAPVDALTVRYYARPNITDVTMLDDWIADTYTDLIILWAAATVLAAVNEQEVKSRVENLAVVAVSDMISDALQSQGR